MEIADFTFQNHGSICLLQPLTKAAQDWLDINLDPEAQHWGTAVVIEPRYAHPIVHDLMAEGYQVEFP